MLHLGNCLNNVPLTPSELESDHLYRGVMANIIQLLLKASSPLKLALCATLWTFLMPYQMCTFTGDCPQFEQ